MKCHEHLRSIANIFPALDRRNELLSALADRMRDVEGKASALDAQNKALRSAGDAIARHVAEDMRGQTARKLVEAWEEASR